VQKSYMRCMLAFSSFVKVLGILTNPPCCNTTAANQGSVQAGLVTAVLALFTNMYVGNVLKQTIIYDFCAAYYL
jgi:hypothetical protein